MEAKEGGGDQEQTQEASRAQDIATSGQREQDDGGDSERQTRPEGEGQVHARGYGVYAQVINSSPYGCSSREDKASEITCDI